MIRCYKYWAEPASKADADLFYGQMKLAGDYRRVLVDIENRGRTLRRALWSRPLQEFSHWERQAYFLLRSKPAKRERHPRAAWACQRVDTAIKEWLKSGQYKALSDRIFAEQREASRRARGVASAHGLHYGTYWLVEDAVSTATRTTEWSNDLGHHAAQRVGAPIDAAAKPRTDQLGESHTRFQLFPNDLYALGERIDGYRVRAHGEFRGRSGQVRAKRMCRARIRVGSEGRSPRWADLHVLMHRPLPPGTITGAWAQRHVIGGVSKWEIVISVDLDEQLMPKVDPAPASRRVAVDIGWRRLDDGIRIAYWVDSDGNEGEWVIPVDVERRKSKSHDLRSIRDNWQNRVKAALRDWKQANPGTWLDADLRHLELWRKVSYFVALEKRWRDIRIPGDAGVYELLVEYLKKDRHLHSWEGHNLAKMGRQIRGRIEQWAHELAKHHGVVLIEKFNLGDLKEDDSVVGKIAARSIQKLAPGEIRLALKHAVAKFHGQLVETRAMNTTRTCAQCGELREPSPQLVIRCDKCGFAEDQDRTAARNILASGAEIEDGATKEKKKLRARRNRRRIVTPAVDQPGASANPPTTHAD